MSLEASHHLKVKLKIIKELGNDLKPGAFIMDLGCGSGGSVQEFRKLGFEAFGCDLVFREEKDANTEKMQAENVIRLIKMEPYTLPFEDNTFDFVFSDQVFEHVQNYPETIAEIHRILKPDGCCLHIFPSRLKPIESHVYVPFSSVIGSHSWLRFWGNMGIRNSFQTDLTAKETAKRNYDYLRSSTNYLSKKQLDKQFKTYFKDVVHCENLFLKYSNRGHSLYVISRFLWFLPSLYGTFRSRVLFAKTSHGDPITD